MTEKTKRIKMPFDCVIMDKESKEVANPYMGKYDLMEKGIAWFRANYPKEYFVLLD